MGWQPAVQPADLISASDQLRLSGIYSGSLTGPTAQPWIEYMVLLANNAGIPFPDGPGLTPAEVGIGANVLGLSIGLPKASAVLAPVTVPGDGTPTVLAAGTFFAPANGALVVDATVVVTSSTGTVDGCNVASDPVPDGPFGDGAAVGFQPATGLGTDTLAMAGRSILSWASDLAAGDLTVAVVTSDGLPADVRAAWVMTVAITGTVVAP